MCHAEVYNSLVTIVSQHVRQSYLSDQGQKFNFCYGGALGTFPCPL